MKRQAMFVCGALVLIGGCVIVKPGVLDAGGDESGGPEDEGMPMDSDDDGGDDGDDDGMDPDPDPDSNPDPNPDPDPGPSDGDGCAEALDILVVLDNSGSMAPFQRRLADAVPLLIDGLDQAGVDWRLAVTTTDNGNAWCPPATTTPEAGSFVFSPCTSRIDDFVFAGDLDIQDYACNDICSLGNEDLQPLPTAIDEDGMDKPRPWLQRENGQLNLAADVDEAIRCLLPMGINGCGFEQQLESMRLGLARTTDSEAPEYGFLRDDASLLIVLVTDEADGSFRPEFADEVLDADGDKTFWSDKDSPAPTSAVCWNAGVECFGDPDDYDDCVAANKDVNGDSTMGEDAVLYPVSRYQAVLTQIEAYKRSLPGGDGADVAVLAVTGVGLDGTFTYADVSNTNPDFQRDFGIGPGCQDAANPEALAVPPVRIREVAQHLSTQPFASICAASFDQAMLDTLDHLVGDCS